MSPSTSNSLAAKREYARHSGGHHAIRQKEALETIGKLPDDADMDEIMCRLYVLDKIRKGRGGRRSGAHHSQRRSEARDRYMVIWSDSTEKRHPGYRALVDLTPFLQTWPR